MLLISWLHFLASALMSIPFLGWHGSAYPTLSTIVLGIRMMDHLNNKH